MGKPGKQINGQMEKTRKYLDENKYVNVQNLI
jgi:hypothetical protein